jgi:hypothetical protein
VCVPGIQGKYQINDTHLHFPFKSDVKMQAQTWYTTKVLKYTDMWQREDKPISDELFYAAVKSLMGVPQLRAKAPEWLEKAIQSISTVSVDKDGQSRNLIEKGWKDLYIDEIYKEGMLEEAQKHHDEQAEARRNREVEDVLRRAPPEQQAQAVSAIFRSTAQEVDRDLPKEVQDVVRLEGAWHEAAVPVVREEEGRGKPRPGTSSKALHNRLSEGKAMDRLRQGDSSDDNGEALVTRMEGRKRKKQAPVPGERKKTKYSELDPKTWKVRFICIHASTNVSDHLTSLCCLVNRITS